MRLDFIIIGAQKSGSTVIQKALDEHPDLFIPFTEIPYFEEPDYSQNSLENLEQHLFSDVARGLKCGIKRPNYLGKLECAVNIHHDVPEAKLIICLRNPIDRFLSSYFHYMRDGFIPLQAIEVGIPALLDGQYAAKYRRANEIIDFGFYAKHLRRYYEYFASEQIYVTLYHDFVANPVAFMQKVYAFLGVSTEFEPRTIYERPQAAIYSVERLRILNLGNRFRYTYNADRTRLAEKQPSAFGKLVLRLIKSVDYRLFHNHNPRPKLTPELRDRIYNLYADDIHELESMLGIKLDHWR